MGRRPERSTGELRGDEGTPGQGFIAAAAHGGAKERCREMAGRIAHVSSVPRCLTAVAALSLFRPVPASPRRVRPSTHIAAASLRSCHVDRFSRRNAFLCSGLNGALFF